MNNSKEQISASGLMFSVGCFIQGSTLLVGFVTGVTMQDTWMCVLFGFIVALPIVFMLGVLGEKFPGKNLIDINEIVFGKVVGKIISSLYVFFFLSLTFLNTSVVTDFVNGAILTETPEIVILIMFVAVCGYAVYKGLETMTRYSVIILIIVVVTVLFNSALMVKDMKFENFQPMFTFPLIKYVQSTHEIVVLPFNILVFSMLFSSVKKPSQIKKSLFGGFFIGAIILMFFILRDTAIFGPLVNNVANPTFDAIRLINLANTLTRMEILYAIIMLLLLFFKISILFYATAKGLSQIFNLKTYKSIVLILGVIIIFLSYNSFDSSLQNTYFAVNIGPAYQTFFEVILPLLTLIVASIRGFRKPVGVSI